MFRPIRPSSAVAVIKHLEEGQVQKQGHQQNDDSFLTTRTGILNNAMFLLWRVQTSLRIFRCYFKNCGQCCCLSVVCIKFVGLHLPVSHNFVKGISEVIPLFFLIVVFPCILISTKLFLPTNALFIKT